MEARGGSAVAEEMDGRIPTPWREGSQLIKIFSFQRKWYGFNLFLSIWSCGFVFPPFCKENPSQSTQYFPPNLLVGGCEI